MKRLQCQEFRRSRWHQEQKVKSAGIEAASRAMVFFGSQSRVKRLRNNRWTRTLQSIRVPQTLIT